MNFINTVKNKIGVTTLAFCAFGCTTNDLKDINFNFNVTTQTNQSQSQLDEMYSEAISIRKNLGDFRRSLANNNIYQTDDLKLIQKLLVTFAKKIKVLRDQRKPVLNADTSQGFVKNVDTYLKACQKNKFKPSTDNNYIKLSRAIEKDLLKISVEIDLHLQTQK